MKKLYLILVMSVIMMNTNAQNNSTERAKADFNLRMESYINSQLANPAIMASAKQLYGHTCDKDHIDTADEIKARVSETERGNFIQANLAEYMRLYFPENSHRGSTSDTLICDNGGFEDDFLYYRGYTGLFTNGSNTCTPLYGSNPVSWTPVTMPVTNRFEIMTTGTDPLVGIQKVKFGDKSLRINNKYGHLSTCDGNYGIDRVTKRFKVTEDNRHFTVWYAVALENPIGHINEQPFLNIKCDKAPADELCFDADFLKCGNLYYDPICAGLLYKFDTIDVVDWACHRFTIPASEIGTIATVEMIVADCGQGAHFGYAYIDGFCEECAGSSLGSINLEGSLVNPRYGIEYFTCNGLTAKVCGSYTLPTLCGIWDIDTITVPGYSVQNVEIDRTHRTFCFEFLLSNFTVEDCLDISALISYTSSIGMNLPPQYSNPVAICKDLYSSYDYDLTIGNCNDNNTSDNLSDDYYYVTLDLNTGDYIPWSMLRALDDPYPGESGVYGLTSGIGSKTMTLGPFMIQEGCWELKLDINGCEETEHICPPEYCSGCSEFAGLKISNIQCIPGTPNTWSFDVYVPGTGGYKFGSTTCNKGTTCSISGGNILTGCIDFEIIDSNSPCENKITVCPPRPCSLVNCQIEVYPVKWICNKENGKFSVELYTKPTTGLCYSPSSTVSGIPSSGVIGEFMGDTNVKIYVCGNEDCYKWIHIPKLPCGDNEIGVGQGRPAVFEFNNGLKVIPNPIQYNMLLIHSDLLELPYEIFNVTGQYILSGKIKDGESNLQFDYPNGLYYIRYKDIEGKDRYYKFIKL